MAQNGSATTSKPTINGERTQSQTLNHVTSYPLISDLLHFYQSNSLGAKSIEAYRSLYGTIVEPVLPYLQGPYSVAHPYLERADSFGDSSLDTIDNHFPSLKSTDFEKLRGNAQHAAYYPFELVGNTRDYVFSTYEDESKKVGGDGVVGFVKAVVSTELRIASEFMHAAAEYIGPKKDELEGKYEQTKKDASEKVQRAKKTAQNKADQVADSR